MSLRGMEITEQAQAGQNLLSPGKLPLCRLKVTELDLHSGQNLSNLSIKNWTRGVKRASMNTEKRIGYTIFFCVLLDTHGGMVT